VCDPVNLVETGQLKLIPDWYNTTLPFVCVYCSPAHTPHQPARRPRPSPRYTPTRLHGRDHASSKLATRLPCPLSHPGKRIRLCLPQARLLAFVLCGYRCWWSASPPHACEYACHYCPHAWSTYRAPSSSSRFCIWRTHVCTAGSRWRDLHASETCPSPRRSCRSSQRLRQRRWCELP
jgi:hypothetical protein